MNAENSQHHDSANDNGHKDAGHDPPGTMPKGRVITELSDMPVSALIDEKELARLLNRTDRTIRKMVRRWELPPPIQFGGRSTWIAGKVVAWIAERADRAASKAQEMERKVKG